MRLEKILNLDALQAYSIKQPTKRIKTMFPRKYIFIISMNGKTMFGNVDVIPRQFYFMPVVGYIFTYAASLPDILQSNQYLTYTSYGRTHPIGLDQYFINSNSDGVECDLVLSCTGTNEIMPIQMFENIIIRCNSHQLVSNETKDVDAMATNIKTNIKKIIINMLKTNTPANVEEWLLDILDKAPFNDNDMPYRYPERITDDIFKSKTINFKNNQLSIGYDLRADSYEFESKFIHALELAFESQKQKVTIYNTYNGLMDRVIEGLKKKKLPYEQVNDHAIEVKLGDFWSLKDLDIKITDLI